MLESIDFFCKQMKILFAMEMESLECANFKLQFGLVTIVGLINSMIGSAKVNILKFRWSGVKTTAITLQTNTSP